MRRILEDLWPVHLPGRISGHVPDHLYHREARPTDAALALQWTGTAGFRVAADDHHFWLDPHLSRHSLRRTAAGPIAPIPARIRREVDRCDAIAVGHSHHDHLIDTPWLAVEHHARVFGSQSTLNACRGAGVAEELLTEIVPGGTYDQGPFTLRPVRSVHSPLLAGRVPLPGRILAPLVGPARFSAYRVGEVFGLHLSAAAGSIYHVGSANLLDAELQGVQADVVLACTVGRQAVRNFTGRLLDALRPKLVIPCHWDRFWQPIDKRTRQIPGNDLQGFIAECTAHDCNPEVRVLPIRGWTKLA